MPSDPDILTPSQLFAKDGEELSDLFKKEINKTSSEISRYQIIEELGKGGMGCVYKAFDPQMNKFIALKTMLWGSKQKDFKRFVLEAKAMAKLNHPNIVRVYDIEENHKTPFIVMDFIEGLSLKEYLQSSQLNSRFICQLMVKIGKAIQYAHVPFSSHSPKN